MNEMPDFWPEAERMARCTCGLIWVGYRAGPWIQHATGCEVSKAEAALVGRWIADAALVKIAAAFSRSPATSEDSNAQ